MPWVYDEQDRQRELAWLRHEVRWPMGDRRLPLKRLTETRVQFGVLFADGRFREEGQPTRKVSAEELLEAGWVVD